MKQQALTWSFWSFLERGFRWSVSEGVPARVFRILVQEPRSRKVNQVGMGIVVPNGLFDSWVVEEFVAQELPLGPIGSPRGIEV